MKNNKDTEVLGKGYSFLALLTTGGISFLAIVFLLIYSVEIKYKDGSLEEIKFNDNLKAVLQALIAGGGLVTAVNYLTPDEVAKKLGYKLQKIEKNKEAE